jgi:hypothetical protein
MSIGPFKPAPRLPQPLMTTGIGSLPHTQLEMAMQQALAQDIPYLPQLPRKDPAEYMIPQALEGLPGVDVDEEGNVLLEQKAWEKQANDFDLKLERALEKGHVADFEPSAVSNCAWKPFLWEVEHRKLPYAKTQLAGPITARWALKLDDGRPASAIPKLDQQIFRLGLARSLAMVRAIRETGARPLIFLDEPSLYVLDRKHNPQHAVIFEELRILILALQKEGAMVGLHCCGNTDWTPILHLGLNVLSTDARLSLGALLASAEAFWGYIEGGGHLALGIVPTNLGSSYDLEGLVQAALMLLKAHAANPSQVARVLSQSLLTPACGLALRSVPDCEQVFEDLARAQQFLRKALKELTQ